MLKVDANSDTGKLLAQDFNSGAITFDSERGALYKLATDQEFLISNQDRLVRYDGKVNSYSVYDFKAKTFIPTNALRDGEIVERNRAVKKNDILAKQTWSQFAGDLALTVGQGVVAGAAIGAVGGVATAAVQHAPRGWLRHNVVSGSSVQHVEQRMGLHRRNLRVHTAALHAAGPFHPGDLNPPPPWMEPIIPPPEPNLGDIAQDAAAAGAWGAIGGIVGTFVGGPVGTIVGGVLGGAMGAVWNELF